MWFNLKKTKKQSEFLLLFILTLYTNVEINKEIRSDSMKKNPSQTTFFMNLKP